MSDILVFLVDGFEEIEAIAPIDICRRAGLNVTIVSLGCEYFVTGSHNILVKADCLFKDLDKDNLEKFKCLILPGGPGTKSYVLYPEAMTLVKSFAEGGKYVAAICAAPSVLGEMSLLEGKEAVCFPGYEDKLLGATVLDSPVCVSGNIITSKGAGTALLFGKAIVSELLDEDTSSKVLSTMQYPHA